MVVHVGIFGHIKSPVSNDLGMRTANICIILDIECFAVRLTDDKVRSTRSSNPETVSRLVNRVKGSPIQLLLLLQEC